MKRFLPSSLRVRLLLIYILSVLPAFGLMIHKFSVDRREIFTAFGDALNREASRIARHEQDTTEEIRNVLVMLSHSPTIHAPKSEACRKYLPRLLKGLPLYRNIGVMDTSGNMICSGIPLTGPVNLSDRDYFKKAVETLDFAGGTFQFGRITNRPGINFAYPVVDGKNRLESVVFVSLDLGAFGDFEIQPSPLIPSDAVFTKIDDSGTILASYPDGARAGQPFPQFHSVKPLLSKGGTLVVEEKGTGKKYFYAVASVPRPIPGRKIHVVVSLPEESILAGINRVFAKNMSILASIALLILGGVWFGSGYFIRRPVRALLEATNKVAAGDPDITLGPPYPAGEFGDLARNFDNMTSAIRARRADRKKAEEALRQSEKKYRSTIRKSPFGIYRSTPEGKLLLVNPAMVEMLGYDSEEELMEKNLSTDIYLHPEERQRILALRNNDGQDRVLVVEVEWKRKDGQILHIRASGRLMRNEDGSPAYYEVFVENQTERHSLEMQFRHSQKMEAVGRLAGGIAHDFNNLLGVILGYSELSKEQVDRESPIRANLEEVTKAAARAADLTRQLLAFSRRQVLDSKVLTLNDVIYNTKKMLQRLVGEDIELLLNLSVDSGRVKIDPGQFDQVIMNLVINARDAMPKGGKIVIETRKVDLSEPKFHEEATMPGGPYVLTVVSDTGCGMDDETRRHIFEPFFTTKALGKGTGLGLSTTYGIVKQSGGYIWAYSEPGHGTSFKIYLPRVTGDSENGPDPSSPTAPRNGSETLLVVEDDASIRKIMREFLEAFGYRVLTAGNPDEALRLATSHPGAIDLLVTDVVMPGGSGPDLADRLSRTVRRLKVLFVSGYTDDAISVHGVLKEGAFFLSKPFTKQTLAKKVREILDEGKG